MLGMRSPYQDPTFNAMMRMSTPSQGIHGDNGHDAFGDTLRRGSTVHMDPAMIMRMQQSQEESQHMSSDMNNIEGNSINKEEEPEEEIYHIDLSN